MVMEISLCPHLQIAAQYAHYHYLYVDLIGHSRYCEIISEIHYCRLHAHVRQYYKKCCATSSDSRQQNYIIASVLSDISS